MNELETIRVEALSVAGPLTENQDCRTLGRLVVKLIDIIRELPKPACIIKRSRVKAPAYVPLEERAVISPNPLSVEPSLPGLPPVLHCETVSPGTPP